MKTRLAIFGLLAVAGIVVWVLWDQTNTTAETTPPPTVTTAPPEPIPDMPGEPPKIKPEFRVTVTVDEQSGKNRLCFEIVETHGFYIDHIWLEYGKNTAPTGGAKPSALQLNVPGYLLANQKLRFCTEVVPAELSLFDGKIGKSEEWYAKVSRFKNVREKNPNPLPEPPNT